MLISHRSPSRDQGMEEVGRIIDMPKDKPHIHDNN